MKSAFRFLALVHLVACSQAQTPKSDTPLDPARSVQPAPALKTVEPDANLLLETSVPIETAPEVGDISQLTEPPSTLVSPSTLPGVTQPVSHRATTSGTLKEPASPLDQVTAVFRPEKQPLDRALRLLGRPFGVTFIVEPDAANEEISMEMRDATLREILTAIVETKGLYYEERAGYVTVRRNKTEFYFIEYPSMKRKTAGSVSINLSASQSNNNVNGSINGQSNRSLANQNGGLSGNGQVGQEDQSTLSITKDNDGDIWHAIEKQLRSLLHEKDGETLDLSRASGIAAITASVRRHEQIKPYIAIVNRRINRQVHIKAQVIEVDLSNSKKLGVNWTQAATAIGQSGITFSAGSATGLTTAGPTSLSPESFTARIGIGKLDAVLAALSQQGDVHSESNPSVTTLVNQTTYIKVGEDRTFFTLDSSTEINQPTNGSGASSSRQDVFHQFTQTFGDVLEVTPSVSEQDIITLVASPTISRFKGVTTSPDGRLSGPNSDSKATESIIRLRSGETGVMGGFVFTQRASERRGIPFAERLPLVGRAFRTDTSATRRTELAILITATLDDL
jgi:type II secretory pathway component GspD/PulD (secretin)